MKARERSRTEVLRLNFLMNDLANRREVFAVAQPWGETGAPVAPAIPFTSRPGADRLKNRTDEPRDTNPESPERQAGATALVVGHLGLEAAPPVFLATKKKDGTYSVVGPDRYRIGFYTPGSDGKTKWACLDFDGAGHAQGHALEDPLAAAKAALERAKSVGLPAHLERSKSGKGWHVWLFFAQAIEAAKARKLALTLAPTNAPLAGKMGVAEPAKGRGIEVFPKAASSELGSMVWAPWFHGAKAGANRFGIMNATGVFEEKDPWETGRFKVSEEEVDAALVKLAPPKANAASATSTPPSRPKANTGPATGARGPNGDSKKPGGKLAEAWKAIGVETLLALASDAWGSGWSIVGERLEGPCPKATGKCAGDPRAAYLYPSGNGSTPHARCHHDGTCGAKESLFDALAAKTNRKDAVRRIRVAAGVDDAHEGDAQGERGDSEPRSSAATKLVGLVTAAGAELFHDPQHEGYVTVPIDGKRATLRLGSNPFRDWLARLYYDAEEASPSGQAVEDAIRTLKGQARFTGPELPVFLRVGAAEGRVYLDLGSDSWEVVEVGPDGWRVLESSPVRFRRSRSTVALPHPVAGGSIDELWPFVNVPTEDARRLVAGYLLSAFRPDGPYFVLVVQGEQGSAKSTLVRALRFLVDPAKPALRSVPRNEEDLAIGAKNSWLVALDNLSSVQEWLADALCRLATGGGLGKRELYSNDDETLLDVARPLILNGIPSLTGRHDLADRALVLALPPIEDVKRRTEADLWRELEAARPRILGALLDAVSRALRDRPNVTLPSLPRMADATLWVTAGEPALGFARGDFLAAYQANRREAIELGLEVDLVATAVRALLEESAGPWEGTATELLEVLRDKASEAALRSRDWPTSARVLADRLRRLAPALRAVGIEAEDVRTGKLSRRTWRFSAIPALPSSVAPIVNEPATAARDDQVPRAKLLRIGTPQPKTLDDAGIEALLDAGWTSSGALAVCVACKQSTTWLDPSGQGRHARCAALAAR